MSKAITVINCVAGTTIVSAFYWGYSDRSWSALLHWGLFYVAAVILPLHWARRTQRLLDAVRPPVPRELRAAAYYPVMAGVITMLMGISLIRDAWLR